MLFFWLTGTATLKGTFDCDELRERSELGDCKEVETHE